MGNFHVWRLEGKKTEKKVLEKCFLEGKFKKESRRGFALEGNWGLSERNEP